MTKHFTATSLIVHEDRVLLLWHKKLGSWLPPGGHLEADELPHEGAIRETKEETGLDIEIISSREDIIEGDHLAGELPRPHFMLEEVIPEYKGDKEHRHIDHVFLARPLHTNINTDETVQWFSAEEIKNLDDTDIFKNCKQVCLSVLS